MPDNNGGNAALVKEFVPEDLRDRAYLKDLLDKPWDKESAAAVFKKLDGAETLIGKRPAIPDFKTAKDEDVLKFFEQARPEKADDYEVKLTEGRKVDEGFVKVVREAFHDGRLSKQQAGKVLAKLNEFGVAQEKAKAQAQAKADAEFDTLAKTMLGQENKATMERVKKLISDHAPSTAKASIAKLDDNNLVIMAAVIDAIHKKYAPEDELKTKGGGGAGSGNNTIQEKREKGRALMAEIHKMKPMDPNIEKKQAEVNQLYKEIAEAS